MSKMKKALLMCSVYALVAVVAIGGTLAYFTDRDSEANVFTVGDVAIELNEDFRQGATLIPGVDIKKEATITNTGKNDAWVWLTVLLPEEMGPYTAPDNMSASNNVVHWNYPSASAANITVDFNSTPVAVDTDGDGVTESYYQTNMLWNNVLEAGDTTGVMLSKVYMDRRVDIDPDGNMYWVVDGVATDLNWNVNKKGNPVIHVSAYAMQKDKFDNVEDAYKAYQTQWGDNGAEYGVVPVGYQVSDSDELAAAIEDGETVIWLNPGTYQAPAAAKGKTLTIGGTEDAILEIVPQGQSEANGQLDYSFDGSTVTFNGITIKTNSQLYAGYARLSGTYNKCVIQNTYNLGTGNSAFYDCEINITNEYLRVGGASTAVFDGCTFNTDGRAILVFQDGTSVAQTVTVKDCIFNATAAAKTWNGIHVAAVSIDGTNGTYAVNLEGNNTVDSDFNGLWQIKTGEANVTVNE